MSWSILRSDTTSQISPFSRECFIRHYGEQLKTAVEQEAAEKMQSFCAVFNCSNYVDREKNKSNYRFLSIVQLLKILAKKAWNFESEKGKVVS